MWSVEILRVTSSGTEKIQRWVEGMERLLRAVQASKIGLNVEDGGGGGGRAGAGFPSPTQRLIHADERFLGTGTGGGMDASYSLLDSGIASCFTNRASAGLHPTVQPNASTCASQVSSIELNIDAI